MYYVITKGERGSKKGQFLITFSTERNHKRGRGGQKTPNLDYVIYGCSLVMDKKSHCEQNHDQVFSHKKNTGFEVACCCEQPTKLLK